MTVICHNVLTDNVFVTTWIINLIFSQANDIELCYESLIILLHFGVCFAVTGIISSCGSY